ncbi:MAG: class I SAM-dependent methyltransferase [Chloroflexota bacterium]|nr:MAG: class I SAM-dependent methyltransferase [Chloroflexota bacterium]
MRSFWERNPVSVSAIGDAPGTPEYFVTYDRMREQKESVRFSAWLHEYDRFAGRSVLDVGCGNGYVLAHYARLGARVTGIDITRAGIDISRQRFELSGLRGDFVVGSAEDLPFPDATFDCVCSMGVLHHIPRTQRAIDEIHRVTRQGGRLIVMFYHRNSARFRFAMRRVSAATGKPVAQLVNEVDGAANPLGVAYTGEELRAMLSSFRQVETFAGQLQGWHLLPRGGRWIPRFVLDALAPRLGWLLYARGYR